MPAPLTEGNLHAIYAVLADYRQARDQHDTQAIADITAGLDAWLRSLLEIVKNQTELIEKLHSEIGALLRMIDKQDRELLDREGREVKPVTPEETSGEIRFA